LEKDDQRRRRRKKRSWRRRRKRKRKEASGEREGPVEARACQSKVKPLTGTIGV
jgi:hypothetical protein